MNIKTGILTTVAIIAMLGLTPQAWAACNLDGNQTGATSAYELSGQGNISCADLGMSEIAATLTFSSDGQQLELWQTSEEADAVLVKPSNGNRCVYNYPTIALSGQFLTPGSNKVISDVKVCADGVVGIVAAVATVSADTGSVTEDDADPLTTSGSVTITDPDAGQAFAQPDIQPGDYGTFSVDQNGSWIYQADNSQFDIQDLNAGETLEEFFTITSLDGTASNTVTITINGIDEVAPEILPTTTAGDDCTGSIDVDNVNILPDGSVVIAESLDGQTKAACSVTAGSGQAYCEDRCENFRDVGETVACTTTANANGEYDLEACKPCDTALDVIEAGRNPPMHPETGTPMEFCWEKVNSAYESTGDLAGTPPDIDGGAGADIPRTPGTMLKHSPIRQSEISITWFNACYKVPVSLNGRTYWVTTCK